MSNLGRVNLKFKNSVLVQNIFSSLCATFILSLYIVYELNTWLPNPANSFALKNCLFDTVKLTRNANKSNLTDNSGRITFDGEGFWSFGNDSTRNVDIWC